MVAKAQYNFHTVLPSKELEPYIRFYGVFEFENIAEGVMIQEIYPANLTAISFISIQDVYLYSYDDESFSSLFPVSLIGPITSKVYNKLVGTGSGMVIIFSPFGLYRIFGIKMQATRQKVSDCSGFINTTDLSEFSNCIFNNWPEKIAGIEILLIKKLQNSLSDLRGIDKVIQMIEGSMGNVEMEILRKLAHMSMKTFERHFSEKVGITPKLFSRITRFDNAIRMLQKEKMISYVLEACRYADQAHMIKEFERFTGHSPKKYGHRLNELSHYLLDLSLIK